MKEFIETLPTVTDPIEGETLVMYLAALEESISAVLLAERGKKKVHVYFVSRTLHGSELEYPKLEKLILALIHAARRLRSSDGSGAGLMLVSPEGKEYTYALTFDFKNTKIEAEYEAMLAGVCIAAKMKIQELAIFVDSQLVANQVKGLFEARQPIIKQYLEKTKEILKIFSNYSIEHVRRDQNKKADTLSKLASMTFSKLAKEVLVEVLGILPSDPASASKEHYLRETPRLLWNAYRATFGDPLIHTKKAKAGDDTYNLSMAFLSVGDRHCRATANSTRRCKVPCCSHRLLHKIGRSKATDIHNWEAYGEICIGTYRVQIQNTPDNHLR
ncbi:reverse transcriptase domain-containing protein [Tanacetum coccineum]|uniref:Reverse transcriptase domain-containing protein n=1 Tax=Tanacetum coccineum TaxID=301880 RepID=A0ABQ5C032_9ASTR